MTFKNVYEKILANKANLESGKPNCIPFPFRRFRQYLPGIMKGIPYLITASSGIGKSQITKYLFLMNTYKFLKEHPESGIKVKIIWFALEESKEMFILSLISNQLKEKFGIAMPAIELLSYKDDPLSEDVALKIKDCEKDVEEILSIVDVVDTISNPTGMYKYVRDNHLMKTGTVSKKTIQVYSEGTLKSEQIPDKYIPDDENLWYIVVTDHIGLIEGEKGAEKTHEAMTLWSAKYTRKMLCKFFGCSVANIQQQAADTEKVQFTRDGLSIEQKLEPSLSGLADNKLTQRDHMVVIGLFAPVRYEIPAHKQYNIGILKDNYRSLSILKTNIGETNIKVGLFFDGASNTFSELPHPIDERDKLEKIYDNLRLKKP